MRHGALEPLDAAATTTCVLLAYFVNVSYVARHGDALRGPRTNATGVKSPGLKTSPSKLTFAPPAQR